MTTASVDAYVSRAESSRYRRDLVHGLADATIAAVVLIAPGATLPGWFQPRHPGVAQVASVETALNRIVSRSGLSDRTLARALAVSHPTVASMRRGGKTHLTETVDRVRQLDKLVGRVAGLVGEHQPDLVKEALTRTAGDPPVTALEVFEQTAEPAAAYGHILRSRRPAGPSLRRQQTLAEPRVPPSNSRPEPQAMTSLYERGYRQGMSLPTELSVPAAYWNGHDLLWEQIANQLWLIATQDCDLDHFADDSSDLVELRPVEVTDVRGPSGIRSRYFALPDRGRLDGLSLRPLLPAAFIATLPQGPGLSEQRLLALKLWLGRRYDRPAVPSELVPLMRAIAECLARGADRRNVRSSGDPVLAQHRAEPPVVVQRSEQPDGVAGDNPVVVPRPDLRSGPAAADRDALVVQPARHGVDGAVEFRSDLPGGPLPVAVQLNQPGPVQHRAMRPRRPGPDRDASVLQPPPPNQLRASARPQPRADQVHSRSGLRAGLRPVQRRLDHLWA